MDHLTEDTIQTIERIHSAWIDLEVAGKARSLLAFCAEDIELRPPDGPSLHGLNAVLAHFAEGTAQIHSIEISDRQLRGSSESVSLTANYKTTFPWRETGSETGGGKPLVGTAEACRSMANRSRELVLIGHDLSNRASDTLAAGLHLNRVT
jgi:hypothetical protein